MSAGFDRCQWIAGEPSRDDACKCGAPTAPGSPWCPRHHARAIWRRDDAADSARRPAPTRACEGEGAVKSLRGDAAGPLWAGKVSCTGG